ncbi:hypothetical protein DFO67_110140 [Modicisalibacter xianhensis]|uniref:Uncharacterized protein n=1 Tax=Modicisalibacter xianhensis TaxID=442341 RepID=A0A4R8FPT3_9GAMM|nr:hypothetical protein [Halomonas xianhensis]TDX28440.1 hypothetical protein DFO67_110140 [Halomonas xianhensis]
MSNEDRIPGGGELDTLLAKLDDAIQALDQTSTFAKALKSGRVLHAARRVLMAEGGCEWLESRLPTLESAGIFEGSDWAHPQILLPALAKHSLTASATETVMLEALSELRMMAVARGHYQHPSISQQQAHHHLTQVLALNLELLFMPPSEAERTRQGNLALLTRRLFQYLADGIGYEHIVDKLIDEIWRILEQRPIQVDAVKQMILQIAACQANPNIELGSSGQGADRLISSLFGTTNGCREDPGLEVYQQRLEAMDNVALQYEATGFARAMHDTGLVSPYHTLLVRFLLDRGDHLLSEALGLSSTGRDCLLCYRELVHAMVDLGVHPQTPQSLYGLALLLERGILYQPPVAPALWRQVALPLSPYSRQRLHIAFGDTPSPEARLMEGVLCMLGQPLGVGQGNNPTCQSARALSMWSYNDPDYLLQMVAWATRDDEIIMHFEGQPVSSRENPEGVAKQLPIDLDPVSLLVVPHLDRIYAEMGRRCIGRDADPHRWINPEFHGWWTGRGFRIAVDIATGHLYRLDEFLRHFYASYHPFYNGNQPLIHPQPAGIAVTDSAARFIGWHAITLLRVSLDPQQVMRMYFFNPNNDSGQDWGDEVVVSTSGHGERFGESSLPFEDFASRLYIFHYDPLEPGDLSNVDPQSIETVISKVQRSWGADRQPPEGLQAAPAPD